MDTSKLFDSMFSIQRDAVKTYEKDWIMEVKTTKEKILEAANKCPQAKETLKILFPEVFGEITLSSDIVDGKPLFGYSDTGAFISVYRNGFDKENFQKGFLLNSDYKWKIIYAGTENRILIPFK